MTVLTAALPTLPDLPAGGELTVAPLAFARQLLIGGDSERSGFAEKVEAVLGLPLPGPNRFSKAQERLLLWQGRRSWLLLESQAGELHDPAAFGPGTALTEVTGGRLALRLSGPAAPDLLSLGTSLDLSPGSFPAGALAVTRYAHLPATLLALDAGYLLLVERASAQYLAAFIRKAAAALTQA